jgi:hypothetical protein
VLPTIWRDRYLIDNGGALADQPLTHAVQGLQVELIDSLGGNKPHSWALHRLRDGLGITEVVLLLRAHVFRRSVVTKRLQFTTEMMVFASATRSAASASRRTRCTLQFSHGKGP